MVLGAQFRNGSRTGPSARGLKSNHSFHPELWHLAQLQRQESQRFRKLPDRMYDMRLAKPSKPSLHQKPQRIWIQCLLHLLPAWQRQWQALCLQALNRLESFWSFCFKITLRLQGLTFQHFWAQRAYYVGHLGYLSLRVTVCPWGSLS